MNAGASSDLELLDQWKQSELVHVYEGVGPQTFCVPLVGSSDEGAMEMRNGGDVPRVTGQGARAETAFVVDNIGDSYFIDLLREPSGRGRACGRPGLRGSATRTHSPNSGHTSVPNSHSEQFDHCS